MSLSRKILFLFLLSFVLAACRADKAPPSAGEGEEAARIGSRLAGIRDSLERLRGEAARIAADPSLLGVPLHPDRRYVFFENTLYYDKGKDNKGSVMATGHVPVDEGAIAKIHRLEHLEPVLAREAASDPWISMAWFATPESLGVFQPPWDMAAFCPPGLDVTVDILPYRRAVEDNPGGAPVWQEPYVDITGKGYMVTVSAPVYADGSLLGVAGNDIALEPLVRFFREEGLGCCLLLTRGLYVVAGGDEALRTLGVRALGEFYYLRQRDRDASAPEEFRLTVHGDARIRAAAARIADGEQEVRIPLDGREVLLRLTPIPEAGWFLAEVVPL